MDIGWVRFDSFPDLPNRITPNNGLIMKKKDMKQTKKIVDYGRLMTQQEMNVDSNVVSTRGTHRIKRVEIIDGKSYYVFDVCS